LLAPTLPAGGPAGRERSGEADTSQKAAQNSIANLISVPLQNNTDFGSRERTQNVLSIQPVIPIPLGDNRSLITWTIVPIIRQPALDRGDTSDAGLGDINPSAFFGTDWTLRLQGSCSRSERPAAAGTSRDRAPGSVACHGRSGGSCRSGSGPCRSPRVPAGVGRP